MQKSAILVSIAAGLASALLFAGLIGQAAGGLLLPLLTPLPIFIASLGWGSVAGFVSVAVAATAVSAATGSLMVSIPLLVAMGIPAAWIGHLAGLSRLRSDIPAPANDARPALDWYPLSRILMAIVGAAIAACVILGWIIGFNPQEFGPVLAEALGSQAALGPDSEAQLQELGALVVRLVPFVQPALLVAMLAGLLYLAAALTRASGKLPRPRDDIPSAAGLPRIALPIFAGALAFSFLDGLVGLLGAVVAGAFGMAFTLVGLAAMHRRTRGMAARGLLLFSAYAAILLLSIPLFAFLILGAVDVARSGTAPEGKPS
ncbi:hypothetical protein [Aureimonas frigidaquae]|uniref:DUF2232 domain-containing protein n=1 Tax=Aureimonas frigidaquae TaxID=424757 RepID=A0A0P0Z2R0_9HYPH|nr:hypothetical protein [Aureimonas frigidaquae]BAT28303.1 hypothetical protein [Aureimonas frigidaquae]